MTEPVTEAPPATNDAEAEVQPQAEGAAEQAEAAPEKVVFGLDVGSMTARCTFITPERQMPVTVRNHLSNEKTPSCVSIPPSVAREFGSEPKLSSSAACTANHFIALLGGDNENAKKLVNYKVAEDGVSMQADVDFKVPKEGREGRQTITVGVHQTVAMLLNETMKYCSEGSRREKEGAQLVLSCPAHWSNIQMRELFAAALITGVPKEQITVIPSHVASLINFHHSRYLELKDSPVTLAVVDVGHSHCNVCVATVSQIKVEVHSVEGLPFGAHSADLALVDKSAAHLQSKFQLDIFGNPKFRARVEKSCRSAKEKLSTLDSDEVQCEALGDYDLFMKASRAEMEDKVKEDFLDKFVELCAKALADSGKTKEEVQRVEIIGGGVRMPVIRDAMKGFWEKDLGQTLDSSLAVCTGASVFGVIEPADEETNRILESCLSKLDCTRRIMETLHHVELANCPSVDWAWVEANTEDGASALLSTSEERKAKEEMMQERDNEYTAYTTAQNALDSFLFSLLGELKETPMRTALGARAGELEEVLNQATLWMDDEEIEKATGDLDDKLSSLQAEVGEKFPEVEAERVRQREERAKKDAEMAEEARIHKAETKKEPRTDDERVKFAEEAKAKGNELFKNQHYTECMSMYVRALGYLGELYATEGEKKELKDSISLSCYLNLAASCLKENLHQRAVENCKKAIEISPKSAKAYFRKGQAHIGLNEFEDSRKALDKAVELAPEDKLIQKEQANLAKKVAAHEQKEKKMYSKMFG